MLPWAHASRPHVPADFAGPRLHDFVARIAGFAVARGVDAILAPTRPLDGTRGRWREWLAADLRSCEALRDALDAGGGQHIAIDYPVLATYEAIRDEASRRALVEALRSTPAENLWLRVSGFGRRAVAVGVRKYINAARDFHSLNRPIIADGTGGVVGLAILAFGAAAGISHGITDKERFDIKNWRKPRSGASGGQPRRVYIPGLDLYLTVEQTRALFASRGAKAMLACNEGCCPRGVEDMLQSPKAHFLNQRARQVSELGRVPELRRADHFLRKQLAPTGSTARKAERLNLSDTALAEKLRERSRRLDEMHQVLEDLHETGQAASRSASLTHRAGSAPGMEARRR